jgi:hypothetical protein
MLNLTQMSQLILKELATPNCGQLVKANVVVNYIQNGVASKIL